MRSRTPASGSSQEFGSFPFRSMSAPFARGQADWSLGNDDVERLYSGHAGAVLAFFARRVLSPEVAVDLMAETFAQAYRDRGHFRGGTDDEAVAWIFGIARHVLSAYLRRRKVERRALQRLGVEVRALSDSEYDRIEELAGFRDLAERVREGLQGLDDAQRAVLRLRVLEERSYPEVARALGVSEQAARARVSRALRVLRESPGFVDQRSELGHV